VPLVVSTTSSLFGLPAAAPILAAAAALAPGVGVWFVLRTELSVPVALGASLATVASGATSAAAAWGGLPQLFGLGLAPVVVFSAARMPGNASRRAALILGSGVLLLGATSPLVLGIGGVAALLACALATWVRRDVRWLRFSGWIALPNLVLVPLYVTYLSRARLGASTHVPGTAGARSLEALFIGAPVAWAVLGVVALTAPLVLWSRRHEPIWAASTAMTLTATVAIALDLAPRWACLAPTAASVGAAAVCGLSRPATRSATGGVCALAVLAVLVGAPATMLQQRDLYARFVPAGTGAAIAWLDTHTASTTRVAVASVDGAPFGWIVEGWARRPTLVAANPTWLLFPGERIAAASATAMFTARHWPSESSFATARRAHVQLLYAAATWGGVDASALQRARRRHHGLVAYDGPGALILRVPPGAHR
jgi:hypothetical protein